MFSLIARFILRNRTLLLIILGSITAVMIYFASQVQLSYEFAKILPDNDKTNIAYEQFKSTFGEDGVVMVVGLDDKNFYTLDKYNDWYALGNEIKKIDGIEAVASVSKLINLVRNDSLQAFEIVPLINGPLQTQAQVDSIKEFLMAHRFYDGIIFNKGDDAHLMAITFDKKKINSKSRIDMVHEIRKKAEVYATKYNQTLHYSGMPYIRTLLSQKIANELVLFLTLALVVCAIILLFLFRSFNVMLFSLLVVFTGVIWSVGCIVMLGYKITILTGLIPSLITVIGIPNCILLINKYQHEYQRHQNKALALARMIQRIGFTTFLANLTTSIGFGVFYFTRSKLLVEFGLIAAINVMATYAISLILIPIVFSYLPAPKVRHVKHIQSPTATRVAAWINQLVHHHYKRVFIAVIIFTAIGIAGMFKMNVLGYVVDDLPDNDPIYTDLKFFEKHFHGVLPFEISIDTREPKGVFDVMFLRKVKRWKTCCANTPFLANLWL
ncbi:MAG: MMPL family transporter [Bacteroidetes bacterium]|nr:MMPL family transporter [Bacteroidota bacterium]